MAKKATDTTMGGVVRHDEVLTIDAAKRAVQVKDWGWRSFRDLGIPVVKIGRQNYVLSNDLIALFERLRDEQAAQISPLVHKAEAPTGKVEDHHELYHTK